MEKPNSLGDRPIEEKYREHMIAIARSLDELFNPGLSGSDRETGFVLLVFPYAGVDGRANYISNGADRKDIIALFKEQIARFEGQPSMKGTA